MAIAPGAHIVGPESGTIEVRTYREGAARRVGHDLVIEVSRWRATVEVGDSAVPSSITLEVDPHSLHVREGLRGVKPLSDRERTEIRNKIDEEILRGEPIVFRSSAIEHSDGRLTVRGELAIAGTTRPATFKLNVDEHGQVSATLPVTQSDWAIKPYRAFMGALKVRDTIEVILDVSLPADAPTA
jgi:polyisoprenoid-binding protein YceI